MTVLAVVGSTGYKIVLLLHILAIIVGFAPAWLTPTLARLTADGDRAAGEQLEALVLRYSLPGIGLAGLLGFGLVGMSDKVFKFSQAWLAIAILVWLVLLAVIVFVARPAIKAFRDGDAAARGRVMMATGISHLALVVILYLMVFKPGV